MRILNQESDRFVARQACQRPSQDAYPNLLKRHRGKLNIFLCFASRAGGVGGEGVGGWVVGVGIGGGSKESGKCTEKMFPVIDRANLMNPFQFSIPRKDVIKYSFLFGAASTSHAISN